MNRHYEITQFKRTVPSMVVPNYVNILQTVSACNAELAFHDYVCEKVFVIDSTEDPILHLLSQGIMVSSYYQCTIDGCMYSTSRRVLLQLCMYLNTLEFNQVDRMYIVSITTQYALCNYSAVEELLRWTCKTADLFSDCMDVLTYVKRNDYRLAGVTGGK